MKTSKAWATDIIQYMQRHPVKTLEEATAQIQNIVDMVQKDAVPPAPTKQ